MHSPTKPCLVLTAALVLLAFPAFAPAAVVGHWRFEDGGNLGTDSGPNGLDLTVAGATSVSTVFPNPVPGTGNPNALAADFDIAGSQYLHVADNALFSFQDFTVEAYVQLESAGSGTTVRTIAGHMRTTTSSSAAWQIGVTGTGSGLGARRLFLQLSSDGSNIVNFVSPYSIQNLTNYYVAASVDITGTGTDVTFYYQDLSAGGELLSSIVSNAGITSLADSAANFGIGATFSGSSSTRHFNGIIDEVRLSNTTLGQSELLAVPEPGAASLLLLGGLSLWMMGRGRSLRVKSMRGAQV